MENCILHIFRNRNWFQFSYLCETNRGSCISTIMLFYAGGKSPISTSGEARGEHLWSRSYEVFPKRVCMLKDSLAYYVANGRVVKIGGQYRNIATVVDSALPLLNTVILPHLNADTTPGSQSR